MILLLPLLGVTVAAVGQGLPKGVADHLNRNYPGWKLAPSAANCTMYSNGGYVSGDFDGDGRRDYAVKFTNGDKGFLIAFLKKRSHYKAFVLHDTDSSEVTNSGLGIWKKSEVFEYEDKQLRLRRDAPADFPCESDAGGIHYYQDGKFVGY